MSKHALFIDAGCAYGHSAGSLNHSFVALGRETLEGLGWTSDVTRIEDGWNVAEEVQKILKADLVVIQTPGWWMSTPWQLKKYQDEVFIQPELCGGDGRSRSDASKKYGSGGFLTSKHYMLSSTWNAPLEAFEDPDQFFGGVGIDGVLFPLHRTMAFLGLKGVPSFISADVHKNPTVEADLARFAEHMKQVAEAL